MANTKITDLTALGAQPADTDVVAVVDVSDSTQAASGTTKKVTYTNLIPVATATVKGSVELPTQAEIDAGTATGGTGAPLVVTPDKIRAKAYHDYAADAGASDSYAITVSPAITAYATGQIFTFKANTANTGTASLAVNGLSAITIVKDYNATLVTGDILAGQILTVVYDGTNFQLLGGKSHTPSGTNPIVRTYLTAGSPATWSKPNGLKYVIVEVQAGGGGGGGNTTVSNCSGGGGGGGYSRKLIAAASLGSTETVTTGAGGTAGPGTGGTGGTGGTSSFGTHLSATGGAGGTTADAGGVGGIGSNGDVNVKGGGGGGGLTTAQSSGMGGSSVLGGGAEGVSSDSAGSTGGVYGGGGSGAKSSGSDRAGGAGGAGIVIVTEYYA